MHAFVLGCTSSLGISRTAVPARKRLGLCLIERPRVSEALTAQVPAASATSGGIVLIGWGSSN